MFNSSSIDELPPLTDNGTFPLFGSAPPRAPFPTQRTTITFSTPPSLLTGHFLLSPDVNILYTIVSLASQSPDPPFRALFAAYDTVLADHGLTTEHDQIYFRYLLRLGEGPTTSSNRDLVKRLRRLLDRLGIQIVLGDDGNDEQGNANRNGVAYEDGEEEEQYALAEGSRNGPRPSSRPRRVSFNDSNLEETWVSGGRLDTHDVQLHAAEPLKKPTPRAGHGRGGSGPSGLLARSPMRGRTPLKPLPRARARSLSEQGTAEGHTRLPLQTARDGHVGEEAYATRSASDSSFTSSGLNDIPSSPPAPVFVPPAIVPIPISQMLASADAFYNTTTFRTARFALHRWLDETIRLRQTHHDMYRIATNYDHQTLLHQAFSTWRSALDEKRQAAETARFFSHFERRATRARDLFLVNKAFTHWAQSASDEMDRTNVARRHILRTRYFNAWKDITAINELKCRRLGLRKWFPVWRANTARRAVEDERALAIYEEKLVERMYWKWFWGFCERRAPVWKEARLKRSFLLKLSAHVAENRQKETIAVESRRYHLLRKTMGALVAQRQAISEIAQQAARHRQTKLLAGPLNSLQKHSKLAPRWREYEQSAAVRLASRTLSVWQSATRLSHEAVVVDHSRLLRNAMTKWNDSLRTKVITTMMNERIKAEVWYKWILLERLNLFRRMMDYRLLQRTMQTISIRLAEQRFRLGEAEAMFHHDHRRRLLQSTMLKLNRRSRTEEHLDMLALEFRNEHVMQHILPTWHAKHRHVQKLQVWAEDARFYCLTHTAIRRWKEAAVNAKRARRREAYVTVRRRVKVNLVQNCFHYWRQRSDTAQRLNMQAQERSQSRLFAVGTAAFDQWRYMAHQCAEMKAQSEAVYARQLVAKIITHLAEKGDQVLQNHQAANEYARQTVNAAIESEMMKRLKWQLFCLQRNNDNAAALKDRISEQHRRNMLRYWADQATARKAAKAALDPESPSKPTPSLFRSLRLPSARKPPLSRPATTGHLLDSSSSLFDGEAGEDEIDFAASTTRRAEDWTSFDLLRDFNTSGLPTLDEESEPSSGVKRGLQNPGAATPLPGYLRTPSKRTARQRTRFKAMSAPRGPSAPARMAGGEVDSAGVGEGIDVLVSTTPAPLRPGVLEGLETLTPQVTPFERKMRAGGFGSSGTSRPTSGLVTPGFGKSRFGRTPGFGATGRSVRFFDVPDSGFKQRDGNVGGFDGTHEKSS